MDLLQRRLERLKMEACRLELRGSSGYDAIDRLTPLCWARRAEGVRDNALEVLAKVSEAITLLEAFLREQPY
jgi:hypothetical protein